MSARLVNVDRDSPMLLPPDLREWIPADDMVHFVIEAVNGMKISSLRVNERGCGSEQYPPSMMLALLVYCYANGVFGSRRIERATHRDIAVRYLTGDTHPDHDTICKFRRENFDAVAECFLGILLLAKELGVLKVGTVSTDGTKIRANASKYRSLRYDRAGELIEELKEEVAGLLQKAEEADQSGRDEGQQLPDEISRRKVLKDKLLQARERIEARALQKAQAEQSQYQKKLKARQQRKGNRKGRFIKPPKTEPEPSDQDNLTDPDSRLMRKSKRSSYEQSYNPQITVDAEGSQLILSARATNNASDSKELAENVTAISEQVGKPTAVLADSGYSNEEQIDCVQQAGVDAYVPIGDGTPNRRRHDFRASHQGQRKQRNVTAPWRLRMREKLQTDVAKALYALRKQTAEPVFGIIKQAMGFRQFHLRGLSKVDGEWQLVCLAYNVKRLWGLKSAMP